MHMRFAAHVFRVTQTTELSGLPTPDENECDKPQCAAVVFLYKPIFYLQK